MRGHPVLVPHGKISSMILFSFSELANCHHNVLSIWRRGRDLNSRMGYPISGFQDRHVRPLRHPSMYHILYNFNAFAD